MGGPAKMDGKAVEGVRIFLGGSIGEGPALANEFEKGIPCEESVLIPKLKEICVSKFGARERWALQKELVGWFPICGVQMSGDKASSGYVCIKI